MDDDWDLHAVVRGCAAAVAASAATTTTTTTATTTTVPFPSFPSLPFQDYQNSPFDFPVLPDDGNSNDPFQGLQEIYQEFCVDDPPPTATAAADISATGIMSIPAAHALQPHQEIVQTKPPLQMNMQIQENAQFNNPSLGYSPQKFPATIPPPIRPRRRKSQQVKMVRQMTQEELSADSWAWRKYGQKPIKGSPYPRNYYRCSTSKGCAARKQVERSLNDPGIFVVSYTGEHTHPRPSHRSSLAGSTRSKLSSPSAIAARNNINNSDVLLFEKGSISSSSSASNSSFSPNPSMEGEAAAQNDDDFEMAEEDNGAGDDDDENIFMFPNDDDDMFKGFQDSDHSSGGGDYISSGLLPSSPWSPTGSGCNAALFNDGGGV